MINLTSLYLITSLTFCSDVSQDSPIKNDPPSIYQIDSQKAIDLVKTSETLIWKNLVTSKSNGTRKCELVLLSDQNVAENINNIKYWKIGFFDMNLDGSDKFLWETFLVRTTDGKLFVYITKDERILDLAQYRKEINPGSRLARLDQFR